MDQPSDIARDFQRIPGLFRRWELSQVVEAGSEYRIEDAGETEDGTPLFAVWRVLPETAQGHPTPAATIEAAPRRPDPVRPVGSST